MAYNESSSSSESSSGSSSSESSTDESSCSDSEIEDDDRDPSDPYYVEDLGYRFFHLSNVHQAFQESHKCKNAQILFIEDHAKRYGQSALFCLQCSKCKKKTYLPTSRSTGNSGDAIHTTDINRRLVYAASETGIGREGMATICSILNMPQPMSSKSWNDHTNALYTAHKEAVEKHLKSTRARLRRKLKKETPTITDKVMDIAVTFDGTWSKRGHTPNYGFGFVISVETGQVLDYSFKSKICWVCSHQKADKESDEYKEWYATHLEHCFVETVDRI